MSKKNKINKLLKSIIKKSLQYPFDLISFHLKNDGRFVIKKILPIVTNQTEETYFDLHYIYHPGWAARVIHKTKPKIHTDISSTLYFCSILSAFVPVNFYDYRPANVKLNNLKTGSADLTKLPFADNSIESLSCMHTVEHIGLGRYGDPIDPKGDIKAMQELSRVLAKGGDLLFVTPVGKPQIVFNAHRIYSYEQIISYFKDLQIVEFSLISKKENALIINADPALVKKEDYGCGCFWFKKN